MGKMPHSPEAEESVISEMINSKNSIPIVISELNVDDFYLFSSREIFEVIIKLFSQEIAVDSVSLAYELNNRGSFDKIGGIEFLARISIIIPSSDIKIYIKMIQEKSTLRKLLNAASEISKACSSDNPQVETLINFAENKIFEISNSQEQKGLTAIKPILNQNAVHISELINSDRTHRLSGTPTNFVDLDKMTSGLHKTDLVLIAARPGMGKTSLALNIAQNVAYRSNQHVVIFSLEMSKEQIANRIWCSEAKIPSMKLRAFDINENDWVKMLNALELIAKCNIYIDDSASITPSEIRAKCKRLKDQKKELGLVIIDYIQLMQSGLQSKSQNRQQEISDISRSLKILAKDLDVPVIALSQLSRAPEVRAGNRPSLSDLRDSGAIEQDADIVMLLYREDYYNEDCENPGIAECIIAKHRNGPTGVINLKWLAEYTKFGNLDTVNIN